MSGGHTRPTALSCPPKPVRLTVASQAAHCALNAGLGRTDPWKVQIVPKRSDVAPVGLRGIRLRIRSGKAQTGPTLGAGFTLGRQSITGVSLFWGSQCPPVPQHCSPPRQLLPRSLDCPGLCSDRGADTCPTFPSLTRPPCLPSGLRRN